MGNEKYFDENVVLYDKFRPTYGTKIFEDILSYGRIKKSSKILEIGCGTGNATLPMIRTGAEVTAVEIGDNLSKYTAQKFSQYSNFHVIHSAFEDFQAHAKYDLIFAATAFHWIKPDRSYSKCKELLTAGGVSLYFGILLAYLEKIMIFTRKFKAYIKNSCQTVKKKRKCFWKANGTQKDVMS